jgi:hypothetical protein
MSQWYIDAWKNLLLPTFPIFSGFMFDVFTYGGSFSGKASLHWSLTTM